MASTLAWQKAAAHKALTAAISVERDLAEGYTPVDDDVTELVAFTKTRATEEISLAAGVETVIAELDRARAAGTPYTYGMLQDLLRALLAPSAPTVKAAGE